MSIKWNIRLETDLKAKKKKVRRHFQQRQSSDDFTKKSHWIIFSCEIAQFDFSDDVFQLLEW